MAKQRIPIRKAELVSTSNKRKNWILAQAKRDNIPTKVKIVPKQSYEVIKLKT